MSPHNIAPSPKACQEQTQDEDHVKLEVLHLAFINTVACFSHVLNAVLKHV